MTADLPAAAGPADAGPAGSAPALSLRGLTKRFDALLAVDGVDLEVPVGSFFGLVGPNGAGKTTTLSMATGVLRPDAGSAEVLGHPLWGSGAAGARASLAAKRLLGVLPDGMRLFDRLTGAELVRYAGLLQGLARPVALERSAELLAALDLEEAAGSLVADYSAGMTKKVSLACALVHAPRVLVLDEPFEAVDPLSAGAIRGILASFTAGGGTVVLSSHVMELVERLCDRVAVVARGRVLAAGTLAQVRGAGTLEERFLELVGAPGTAGDEGALGWLRQR